MTRPSHYVAVTNLDAFHDIGVAFQVPELALIAAVLHAAACEARAGNDEARAWLAGRVARDCLALLSDAADLDVVQARLLHAAHA